MQRSSAAVCLGFARKTPPSSAPSSLPPPKNTHPGFLDLLGQLTTVGDVDRAAFEARLAEVSGPDYHVAVAEDAASGRLLGTAALIVERKFIHACGKVRLRAGFSFGRGKGEARERESRGMEAKDGQSRSAHSAAH